MKQKRKLSTFPNIVRNIDALSSEDDALCRLHEILFGNSGLKSTRKSRILNWKISRSDNLVKAVRETEISTILKEICAILHLDIPDGRPNVERSIIEFLSGTGKKYMLTSSDNNDQVEVIISKKVGRKLGGKNRPKHVIEAERAARMTRPYRRRARTVSKPIEKEHSPVKKRGRKKRQDTDLATVKEMVEEKTSKETEQIPVEAHLESTVDAGSRDILTKIRGRPRKYKEPDAFRQFVRSKHPEAVAMWETMTGPQRAHFWVRHTRNNHINSA